MSLSRFDKQSEKYGQYGNMSAQGVKKLLGAPSHDRLEIVIRESVQNSSDAVKEKGSAAEYRVGIRRLSISEQEMLKTLVYQDHEENGKPTGLSKALEQENLRVLELTDFGTIGLGGPTDASKVTEEGDATDYIDFVRNFGSPRDTEFGGGTYGYGKSSLFGMSQCSTILVDSLTISRGREERRMVGIRIASSYTCHSGDTKGKYTGRHWWGKYDEDGETLSPYTGEGAELIAKQLGLPERNQGDTGTTVMILDPISDYDSEQMINRIQRILLWNFWPKMISYESESPTISFRTFLDGREITLPSPENVPPLGLFADSMRALKNGEAVNIRCQKPTMDLGKLSITSGQRGDRISGFDQDDNDEMFPERCCHTALMRPAELVVKYLEGNPFPSDSVEWAGTFVSSSTKEVEEAFATSEPPAHDDWNPAFLSERRARTFVRTAIRRIYEQMDMVVGKRPQPSGDEELPLAALSDRLGELLNRVQGDGLSINRKSGRRGGKGRRKTSTLKIKNLSGWGPGPVDDGRILAWFNFEVDGPENADCLITGKPGVFIDGENADEAPNGQAPEIVVWMDADEQVIGEGPEIRINVRDASQLWAGITIPDNVAVTFSPEICLHEK